MLARQEFRAAQRPHARILVEPAFALTRPIVIGGVRSADVIDPAPDRLLDPRFVIDLQLDVVRVLVNVHVVAIGGDP